MPGPLVHKAAMENLYVLLIDEKIPVIVGSYFANIKTDLEMNSHGYSMELNTGSIFEKLIKLHNAVLLGDIYDGEWLSKIFRHICHLCTDSMSIGQISDQTWGKFDNRFDFFGEFVKDKRKLGCMKINIPFETEFIKYTQLETMQIVYDLNINICKKWDYCLSHNFRKMIRMSVFMGSYYAFLWCKHSVIENLKLNPNRVMKK